jgi:AcrR family transcriptional regulator
MDKRKIRQSPKLPAEQRRRQLVDAAWKLFSRKGYLATTTEEIAAGAGVTKGALYFHFKTKEDLLFEIVKGWLASAREAVIEGATNNMRPVDFLRILTGAGAHCRQDWAESAGLWVQAIRIPRIKAYLTRQINDYLDFFVQKVTVEPQLDETQLRQLGLLVFALHDGLEMLRYHYGRKVDIEALVDLAGLLTLSGSDVSSVDNPSPRKARKKGNNS